MSAARKQSISDYEGSQRLVVDVARKINLAEKEVQRLSDSIGKLMYESGGVTITGQKVPELQGSRDALSKEIVYLEHVSSASKVCLGPGLVLAHKQWRPCTDSRLYVACFYRSCFIRLQCGSYCKPLHNLPSASRSCSSRVRMLAKLPGIAVQPLSARVSPVVAHQL